MWPDLLYFFVETRVLTRPFRKGIFFENLSITCWKNTSKPIFPVEISSKSALNSHFLEEIMISLINIERPYWNVVNKEKMTQIRFLIRILWPFKEIFQKSWAVQCSSKRYILFKRLSEEFCRFQKCKFYRNRPINTATIRVFLIFFDFFFLKFVRSVAARSKCYILFKRLLEEFCRFQKCKFYRNRPTNTATIRVFMFFLFFFF